ncbi:MAG: hypothetical protein Q7J29_03275 [Stagnimonas sp.]|nr:hypothetical protein [Stagnimonas sp.]
MKKSSPTISPRTWHWRDSSSATSRALGALAMLFIGGSILALLGLSMAR